MNKPQAKDRVNYFDFNNLFTFEMANNHQGSIEHGKKIVAEMASISKEFGIRSVVKIQLRDLDTFIHPDFKNNKEAKHISRFLSTRLSKEEFGVLVEEIRSNGLLSMATPFDESSVDFAIALRVDILKVASCSAQDWPLLEKISSTGKPVIVSVGGLTIKEVDKVVSFFEHRGVDFAIMHCVAIYPTPIEKLHLNQIEMMKNRYPNLVVGFSTHESPDNTDVIGLAYAKGARIFEKHVGIETDNIKLNSYSANPAQVRKWIKSYMDAVSICGSESSYRIIDQEETKDLQSLKRGVFAKKTIKKGQTISSEDVFFAMPITSEDQLESGKFKEGVVADREYSPNEAIPKNIYPDKIGKKDIIYNAVREAKALLNMAKIPISHDFVVEVSHHYGLENFDKVGCIILDCINREYARKLIIQFPGQFHPVHYHKVKDESFHVLSGSMEADIEGKKKMLFPGDTIWVPRGVWHSFKTDTGVIFEEISTTSLETIGDSFYIDKDISSMSREKRKTRLLNWGRHQFDENE